MKLRRYADGYEDMCYTKYKKKIPRNKASCACIVDYPSRYALRAPTHANIHHLGRTNAREQFHISMRRSVLMTPDRPIKLSKMKIPMIHDSKMYRFTSKMQISTVFAVNICQETYLCLPPCAPTHIAPCIQIQLGQKIMADDWLGI